MFGDVEDSLESGHPEPLDDPLSRQIEADPQAPIPHPSEAFFDELCAQVRNINPDPAIL